MKGGFSQINLIKTFVRNCISAKVIHDLLMIKLYGPALMNFNLEKAIKVW